MSAESQYEFSQTQEQIIAPLAKYMKVVGLLQLMLGVLALGSGLESAILRESSAVTTLVMGTVFLPLGFWTRKAAHNFGLVVDTTGSDIDHMMRALDSQRKLYGLQYSLLVVAVLAVIIGVVATVALGFAKGGLPV